MAIQRPRTDGVRVDLYRRSYVPETFETRIEEFVDRIETLVADGTADRMRIRTWNSTVRVSVQPRPGTDPADCVERHREFAAWAESAGVALEPFFEVERLGRHEVITFPICAVAVYDGEDLVAVAPCKGEDEVWTVPEYLDAVERTGEWTLPL